MRGRSTYTTQNVMACRRTSSISASVRLNANPTEDLFTFQRQITETTHPLDMPDFHLTSLLVRLLVPSDLNSLARVYSTLASHR